MALKMMTTSYISSKVDRQYFDDNMLTDEDFRFESDDFLEIKLPENMDTFEKFANEIQADMQHQNVTHDDTQPLDFVESLSFGGNLDDLLRNCLDEEEISMGSPPYSNGVPSPDNNVSVISIPDDDSNSGINGVVTDTPPLTPPTPVENIPNSPQNCSPINPIIVSVRTMPTLTYIVPPTHKQPVKQRLHIQPKPASADDKEPTGIDVLDSDSVINLTSHLFGAQEQITKAPRTVTSTITIQAQPTKSTAGRNGARKSDVIDACTAALKRQERIIKNRESAYLSRKRKKEYVTKLEEKLNEISTENTGLREENCRLKNRIIDLEKEVFSLKAAFSTRGMKKTVCLMVVICMVTFNFASYGSLFQRIQLKPPKANAENHRIGRTLLWTLENNTKEQQNTTKLLRPKRFIKEEDESPYIVTWDGSYNFSTCQQFINKSESLRLENDLLGWVKRVEKKQKLKENKLKKKDVVMKQTILPLPKLQQLGSRFRQQENQKDIWAKRKSRNEILIYQTPRKDYEDFFDAIHRRDDSFYFVSFSGDHLLLPAIAHNQTLRPKMSFVMPAVILNDSVGDSADHISMMQIDCEVLDTKLVYIKESVIPPHLRQKHNSTKSGSKNNPNGHSRRLQGTTIKLSNHTSGHG